MRHLRLSEIPAAPAPAGPFFHRSGAMLLREGEALTEIVRDRFRRAGIEAVIALDSGEDPERFRNEALAKRLLLKDIADGTSIGRELRDSEGQILTRPNTLLDPQIRELLAKKGIQGFIVRRTAAELGLDEVDLYRALSVEAPAEEMPSVSFPAPMGPRERGRDLTEHFVSSWIDVAPQHAAVPLEEMVSSMHRMAARPPEHCARYLRLYEGLTREVARLQERLKSAPNEPVTNLERLSRQILGALLEDRELLLNLVNLKARGEYLVSHALHTAFLAAATGIALGAGAGEALELVLAGLLARIGMLRVPEAILSKQGPLTQAETAEVRRAPSQGLALLRKIDLLPVRAAIACLQCMERLDGSGYPNGIGRDRIHRQATIVSAADEFDALVARRPWRPALLPYRAMETVLRDVRGGKLDAQVARGLLDTLSLFPLGSWVELSDRRIARVVAATRGEHTRPVVAALLGPDRRPVDPLRIDLAAERSLSVVRPVDQEDFGTGTLDGW